MYLRVRALRVRANPNPSHNPYPNPLKITVLVEDLSLLPFNVSLHHNLETPVKLLKIKQLLCVAFTTGDIIGSDTGGWRLTKCLFHAPDALIQTSLSL